MKTGKERRFARDLKIFNKYKHILEANNIKVSDKLIGHIKVKALN